MPTRRYRRYLGVVTCNSSRRRVRRRRVRRWSAMRCMPSARSSPRCGLMPTWAKIRVSRFVGAFDAGRVMNAKTARSQLIGGIVFGLGMALLEETQLDGETGRIVNANIAWYLVPVNADVL